MRKSAKRKPVVVKVPWAVKLTESAKQELGIRYHMHFEALARGEGNSDHYHTLAQALLVSGELVSMGIDVDYASAFDNALKSLEGVQNRFVRTGRYGCSGDELVAIKQGIALHDAQLSRVSRDVLLDAILRVQKLVEGVGNETV